ncbi:MAG: aminodeoxychorismate/anthranilate synthase component II, partial [Sphingobacteriia bacterium]
MKILVFDNYDSFTYNLVHLVEWIMPGSVTVFRNDELPLEKAAEFDKIILSPGPGIPAEAGLLLPLIEAYAAQKSILGVCLGHQAIGQAFGAELVNLTSVFHGVATPIFPAKENLSHPPVWQKGLEWPLEVGRYHSWVVGEKNWPPALEVTARDEAGWVMGLQHKTYDLQGLQFHPESIL